MSTVSMVHVFDERDNKFKVLTSVRPASKHQANTQCPDNPGVTITHADEPIMPRINAQGNIIL
jgi:hypothetical protein